MLVGGIASTALGQETLESGVCQERPVGFRADIRPPDSWEEAWEAEWPEASDALASWRSNNFELLQRLWRAWYTSLKDLKHQAPYSDMPASALYLHLASLTESPFQASASIPAGRGPSWAHETPVEAMKQAYAESHSSLPLDDWAAAVRTGMRLLENLDLPHVHVIQPGDTVYGIARKHDVSPHCIAAKNNVWDDLQPGTGLLIPDLHR